ncbi:MAG: AAA family ATPase [Cyclobacteriaceae bacterium]|nr:AAA family ATPase [Cyclobacteriaceae bacterium]
MSEIIAVINQKGGTGKTTTSHNLGYGLARKGKKVLFIDLDPQGNLTFSCGINEFEHSLADVIYQDKSLNETIIKLDEKIDLVPTDIELAHTELFLTQQDDREFIISKALKETAKRYDYVIIDCQTSLSVLTINALVAATKIVIPLQMTILSLKGLDLVLSTIQDVKENLNKHLKVAGILPVMIDRRRKLSTEVIDIIVGNFDIHVFKSQIGSSVRAAEAPSFGKSVLEYAPSCNVAKHYGLFVKEFLSITKKLNK